MVLNMSVIVGMKRLFDSLKGRVRNVISKVGGAKLLSIYIDNGVILN